MEIPSNSPSLYALSDKLSLADRKRIEARNRIMLVTDEDMSDIVEKYHYRIVETTLVNGAKKCVAEYSYGDSPNYIAIPGQTRFTLEAAIDCCDDHRQSLTLRIAVYNVKETE